MPLAWRPADSVERDRARGWLARQEFPAAVLLGCSHLISSGARTEATEALAELRRLPAKKYPNIVALAEAQAWRVALVTATRTDVDRWSKRVATFPEPLRAGPYFVVARAYQQLKQPDRATLHYLRVSVLHADRRQLASVALTAAARLSQAAGHYDEAQILLGEVLDAFADTSEHALARQRLQQLKP